ncbi:hypothetical protein MRX96_025367 [Rhipicephalus microplus]
MQLPILLSARSPLDTWDGQCCVPVLLHRATRLGDVRGARSGTGSGRPGVPAPARAAHGITGHRDVSQGKHDGDWAPFAIAVLRAP